METVGDGFEFLADPVDRFPVRALAGGDYAPPAQPALGLLDAVGQFNIGELGDRRPGSE